MYGTIVVHYTMAKCTFLAWLRQLAEELSLEDVRHQAEQQLVRSDLALKFLIEWRYHTLYIRTVAASVKTSVADPL